MAAGEFFFFPCQMAARAGLIDERELGAFNVCCVTVLQDVKAYMERLGCQAESKWTQVYGNCRRNYHRREVHIGEFKMKPLKKVKGEEGGRATGWIIVCLCLIWSKMTSQYCLDLQGWIWRAAFLMTLSILKWCSKGSLTLIIIFLDFNEESLLRQIQIVW